MQLLELAEEHPSAFEYDFTSRFGFSFSSVGTRKCPFSRAILLVHELAKDPTSRIFAAIQDWDYPASYEYLALLDLVDVTLAANSDPKKRRPKPLPRPWKSKAKEKVGRTALPISKAKKFLTMLNPARKD